MYDAKIECMICAKPVMVLKGGICKHSQDRIRREAMGQQSNMSEQAERELTKFGISSNK